MIWLPNIRPCAKVRYKNELDALIALTSTAGRKKQKKRNESRAYKCNLCHGWHLTSQPKRDKS